MLFRGIKKRLFLQFWILFFLAMMLIDVLILFIFLERNITQTIDQKKQALIAVCEKKASLLTMNPDKTEKSLMPVLVDQNERFLFVKSPFIGTALNRIQGRQDELDRLVLQTLRSGNQLATKHTILLGWFFFQHKFVILTYPVKSKGHTIAAGGVEFSLTEQYRDFNRIQKIALVFVIVVSFLFALIGNQQLLRLYYRPLKRLANLAETFRDEENLFFSVRKEDNEFSVLSSSLNKMLNRIAEDKKVLKDTIGSLRNANKELKKAQNDVIRAEKMASVGRLTSGIAHEIGNPIGIVLGYLDLLKQSDLSADDRIDFIDRSEKEITRINNIIRQMLDMSRSSPGETKPVSMHQLLKDLVSVFSYQSAAAHINIHLSLGAMNDIVFADPDQLRQVFLNILLNAVDEVNAHCADDAWIRIITEQSGLETNESHLSGQAAITVTIEDSGPGIDPSHLPRIFDPFYTTKEPGKGTGLGLSVSFMIIERLGGHISVDQHAASGAAFHVVLPSFTMDNDDHCPED
ncbi:two component system sensor histidine kinase [Desulfosarcina variabilis str. Montpellier]|uniref:sensor histidine kinase n=1 Tax=Desulfosarcina variabilis TaxID=2300 RepID=UPI003AFAA3A3